MDGLPDIGALDTIVTAIGALVALASSGFTETAVLHRRREMFHAISSNPLLPAIARERASHRATEADLRIVAIAVAGSGPAAWLSILFLAATSIYGFLLVGLEEPSAAVLVLGTGLIVASSRLSGLRTLALDMHISVLRGDVPQVANRAVLWRGFRRTLGALAVGVFPALLLSAERREDFRLDDVHLYGLAAMAVLLSIITLQQLDRRLRATAPTSTDAAAGTAEPDPM